MKEQEVLDIVINSLNSWSDLDCFKGAELNQIPDFSKCIIVDMDSKYHNGNFVYGMYIREDKTITLFYKNIKELMNHTALEGIDIKEAIIIVLAHEVGHSLDNTGKIGRIDKEIEAYKRGLCFVKHDESLLKKYISFNVNQLAAVLIDVGEFKEDEKAINEAIRLLR